MTDQLKPCPACRSEMAIEVCFGNTKRSACTDRECEMRGPIRKTEAEAIAASNALPRGWQPIEGMPDELRDGRWILCRTMGVENKPYVMVVRWRRERWRGRNAYCFKDQDLTEYMEIDQ